MTAKTREPRTKETGADESSPFPHTLAEIGRTIAQTSPGQAAIVFHDQPLSYDEFDARVDRAAVGLAGLGVERGDRVALFLPNIPEFAIAYYAILRLGAVVVPINALYRAEEVAYIGADCTIKAIVTVPALYPEVAVARAEPPSVEHVIVVGEAAAGTVPWARLLAGHRDAGIPAVDGRSEDLAVICYTSGTTGRSKGAMLTHRNLIANLEQLQAIATIARRPGDPTLLVLPLFHIFGMNVGLNWTLWAGGTVVLIERLAPEAIARHRCDLHLAAPPMIVASVNCPTLGDHDFSSVRVCISGAAPLPAAVLERFQELTGIGIEEGYGLTETAPVTHCNGAAPRPKPGTIGPTIPGVEARLVDDENHDVPPGVEGEIVVRGENVFGGYWSRPEASAEALRGGRFHTGDVATVDEEGYYTIVDRKKDMINAGGFKIWPREVEEVLYRHPAVREAAVVAAPDPYAGERPVAFVALKPGHSAGERDVLGHWAASLAKFKVPARVEFRDDLPKLTTGKVLRRVLRDQARQMPAEPAL